MDANILHECFTYNEINGEFIWKERPAHHFKNAHGKNIWNAQNTGKKAGTVCACNRQGQSRIKLGLFGKQIMAHRAAWVMTFGDIPAGLSIDHIDGNPHNNAIANLRLTTHAENHKNRKIQSNNKSGVQGVRFIGNRWQARIKINGKEKHLGLFKSKEEAIIMRINYAKQNGFTERHSIRGQGTNFICKLDAQEL